MNVLISSIGRRAQLVECFRRSLAKRGYASAKVFGTDLAPELAPAAHLADMSFAVPRCTEKEFVPRILQLCDEHEIQLVVPTIDTELPVYAAHAIPMRQRGVWTAISASETVAIAGDKIKTHAWLVENKVPTVRQSAIEEVVREARDWRLPLIAKPRFGSASLGVRVIKSMEMLKAAAGEAADLLVQERAAGVEYTVNAFVHEGRCLCAVPHRRLEVRAGEVSKGRTEKHSNLIGITQHLVEALPGAAGPITVQAFVEADAVRIIEINARFGGGFPLAFEAGADFPGWLLDQAAGKFSPQLFDGWTDGLTMLRYDSAVFLTESEK